MNRQRPPTRNHRVVFAIAVIWLLTGIWGVAAAALAGRWVLAVAEALVAVGVGVSMLRWACPVAGAPGPA